MTGSPVRVLNMIPIFEKEFGTELHEYSLNAEKWDIAITRGNEIFTHKRVHTSFNSNLITLTHYILPISFIA